MTEDINPLSFYFLVCYNHTNTNLQVIVMAKTMKACAWISTFLAMLCAVFYRLIQTELFLSLTITFGTTAYHFIMRLLVGWTIHGIFRNHMDYRASWFRVKPFEQKIYKSLGIKNWKGKMPTYDPSGFDRKCHTWDEIAQATCQAELVHEVIILLSFVPLLAAIPFGAFWVFVITSVSAACFDALFVILQRYNRPRILQLITRGEKNNLPKV